MKWSVVSPAFFVLLVCIVSFAGENATDPCPNKELSGNEIETCYSAAERRINIEADRLANKIAAAFIRDARVDQSQNETVTAELERKAAHSVRQSQIAWRQYRNNHCNAVMYKYTTGSIAGGAHESCMFYAGQERIHELQLNFGDEVDDR